jgi:hypothetical protein
VTAAAARRGRPASGRIQPGGHGRERRGLQRAKDAEREEGHVGDALLGELVDQPVVMAVGQVVHVLHAHDRRDRLCLGDLFRCGVCSRRGGGSGPPAGSPASVSNGCATEPGWGPWALPGRRLTTSSTSRPRCTWTACSPTARPTTPVPPEPRKGISSVGPGLSTIRRRSALAEPTGPLPPAWPGAVSCLVSDKPAPKLAAEITKKGFAGAAARRGIAARGVHRRVSFEGVGVVLSPLAEGPGSDAGEVGDVVGEHAGPAGAKSSLSGCAAADGRSVRTPPRFPESEADVRAAVRSRTRRLTKVQRRQNVYRRAARVSMPSIKTSTAKSNRSSPSPATMYAAWAAR